MAADPVAGLPDGLHAAIAGSGSPLPDPRRGNPCVAVIAGRRVFIVDAGEGASETLNRMQMPPQHIEAVLLTHFHSDHIGGLGSLAIQRWAARRGPRRCGCSALPASSGWWRATTRPTRMDSGYRTAHHGEAILPSAGAGLAAEPFAMPEGGLAGGPSGRRPHDHRVHGHPQPGRAGRRLPVRLQGPQPRDQRRHGPTEVLVRAAKGADLLIHDALSRELLKLAEDAARKAGLTERAKIFSDLPDYHASPQEAADCGPRGRRPGPGPDAHRAAPALEGARGPVPGRRRRAVHRPALDGPGRRPVQPALGTGAVERTGLIPRGPAG